ncbi:MAG: hypothetical protein KKD07_07205 [Candidatus Omnitrophica bacterium]|nr:hypothetical protein [Candidatus Omnitrophota bacterium]MBU1996875.1 hypothetical protein [Candidatus Omnitrophota bacterium]MBU4334209.1 hypothetical protein [Candidatus Omnitrophota bacterium]
MKKDLNKRLIDLDTISEEELLDIRINELPLKIEGTWLSECIAQLYKELEEKGISFRPQCYLADEWLTPKDQTCIGIPFFLAHSTLIRIEKKYMIDAEGDTKTMCMKLLRHEAGHALLHAYKLNKRKSWQKIFGHSSLEYSDSYKYRPYSKNFVRHLDGYYAQYHPEEDFVETFAVWLSPQNNWRERYKGWNVIKKLEYVDKLINDIKSKKPIVTEGKQYWQMSTLRISLNKFYKKKRHYWAEEFPDFHDAFLKRVFSEPDEENNKMKKRLDAAKIIRKYRISVIKTVSKYSGEKKFVISDLVKDIQKRSMDLKLVVDIEEQSVVLELTAYVTALIMNYLYTGKFRGPRYN